MNDRQGVRINKYMSEAGFCSRREADRLLQAGEIYIDGKKAVLGDLVFEGNKVTCNGKTVEKEEEVIILALNKPRGIVCTTARHDKNNIVDFVNYSKRVYPVGRLDQDSEGLILLTNDGELMNKVLKARYKHEKEYEVVVNKKITNEFLKGMSAGVFLEELNQTTRKCKIRKVNDYKFNIIITQGLNRQIRRMCQAFDYRVKELKRIRIMNIELANLEVGKYRKLTKEEQKVLYDTVSIND